MTVDRPTIRQPANERLLRYLERRGSTEDDRAPWPERDYLHAGSHPEVVEQVWDVLGGGLPVDCRRVVLGTPALVHPDSKVLLAVALGTQYVIRLPDAVVRAGVPATARVETTWAGGDRLNVRDTFGAGWIFGSYAANEKAWLSQAFEEHDLRW